MFLQTDIQMNTQGKVRELMSEYEKLSLVFGSDAATSQFFVFDSNASTSLFFFSLQIMNLLSMRRVQPPGITIRCKHPSGHMEDFSMMDN